ncbi:hypothetical protein BH09ACT7_BH09ACT7_50990 [soil metagenome]
MFSQPTHLTARAAHPVSLASLQARALDTAVIASGTALPQDER